MHQRTAADIIRIATTLYDGRHTECHICAFINGNTYKNAPGSKSTADSDSTTGTTDSTSINVARECNLSIACTCLLHHLADVNLIQEVA